MTCQASNVLDTKKEAKYKPHKTSTETCFTRQKIDNFHKRNKTEYFRFIPYIAAE